MIMCPCLFGTEQLGLVSGFLLGFDVWHWWLNVSLLARFVCTGFDCIGSRVLGLTQLREYTVELSV